MINHIMYLLLLRKEIRPAVTEELCSRNLPIMSRYKNDQSPITPIKLYERKNAVWNNQQQNVSNNPSKLELICQAVTEEIRPPTSDTRTCELLVFNAPAAVFQPYPGDEHEMDNTMNMK